MLTRPSEAHTTSSCCHDRLMLTRPSHAVTIVSCSHDRLILSRSSHAHIAEAGYSLVGTVAWPLFNQLIPEMTRCASYRGEVWEVKHHELVAGAYGVMDQPSVTKHAQEGTAMGDHHLLEHSGFGPYCNTALKDSVTAKDAWWSLQYWMSRGRSCEDWFHARIACLTVYLRMLDCESNCAGW